MKKIRNNDKNEDIKSTAHSVRFSAEGQRKFSKVKNVVRENMISNNLITKNENISSSVVIEQALNFFCNTQNLI